MLRTVPPFRADHVGSLLRSPVLHDARERRARGELDAAGLAAVEDDEIRALVARQREAGQCFLDLRRLIGRWAEIGGRSRVRRDLRLNECGGGVEPE